MNGELLVSNYLFFPKTEKQWQAFCKQDAVGVGATTMVRMSEKSYLHSVRTMLDFSDDQSYRIQRLSTAARTASAFVSLFAATDCTRIYVSIEDYAMRALGRVYPIGEYGGLLREALFGVGRLFKIDVVLRESDPLSIKLFATKGNAEKGDMYRAYRDLVRSMNGLSGTANFNPKFFLAEVANAKPSKSGKPAVPAEELSPLADLVDSWWISEVMRTELWVRWGWLDASKLTEQRLHVLNRVTKSYPVNVLSRAFLRWGSNA
jgi:hypothetical protein